MIDARDLRPGQTISDGFGGVLTVESVQEVHSGFVTISGRYGIFSRQRGNLTVAEHATIELA